MAVRASVFLWCLCPRGLGSVLAKYSVKPNQFRNRFRVLSRRSRISDSRCPQICCEELTHSAAKHPDSRIHREQATGGRKGGWVSSCVVCHRPKGRGGAYIPRHGANRQKHGKRQAGVCAVFVLSLEPAVHIELGTEETPRGATL